MILFIGHLFYVYIWVFLHYLWFFPPPIYQFSFLQQNTAQIPSLYHIETNYISYKRIFYTVHTITPSHLTIDFSWNYFCFLLGDFYSTFQWILVILVIFSNTERFYSLLQYDFLPVTIIKKQIFVAISNHFLCCRGLNKLFN